MRSAFDLWSHADVQTHADTIAVDNLKNGSMPCDGAWPASTAPRRCCRAGGELDGLPLVRSARGSRRRCWPCPGPRHLPANRQRFGDLPPRHSAHHHTASTVAAVRDELALPVVPSEGRAEVRSQGLPGSRWTRSRTAEQVVLSRALREWRGLDQRPAQLGGSGADEIQCPVTFRDRDGRLRAVPDGR